jgi:hypothetical protein
VIKSRIFIHVKSRLTREGCIHQDSDIEKSEKQSNITKSVNLRWPCQFIENCAEVDLVTAFICIFSVAYVYIQVTTEIYIILAFHVD